MIYAAAALGVMAAATTASAEMSTGRALNAVTFGKFKGFQGDDKFNKKDDKVDKDLKNEGDEGDEGNEGFKFGNFGGLNNDDEGNEGDEGDEGDENDENDEGDEADIGANNSDAGKDDGNEGNEGDEGKVFDKTVTKGGTKNSAACVATTKGKTFSKSVNAHVESVASAFAVACHPEFGFRFKLKDVSDIYEDTGLAAADAFAKAAAVCASTGNAFGCAAAKSQAAAWASATAEAHAEAWAYAYNGCGCDHDSHIVTEQQLEVVANTFIQLSADVYASAEVEVCVKGDQVSSAVAFTKCWARAYATVWTQSTALALLHGNCLHKEAITAATAVTKADYTLIEDCSAFDSASGNAGSENGGGAQAEATEIDLDEH